MAVLSFNLALIKINKATGVGTAAAHVETCTSFLDIRFVLEEANHVDAFCLKYCPLAEL